MSALARNIRNNKTIQSSLEIELVIAILIEVNLHLIISKDHGRRKVHESILGISATQQLSQGRMANFPAFIASKSFDL